ncbi:glycine, alanine and asparagine-rich protein [Monomorium pharaonis]|uniref:glycine, alanine and asparagine-rich protein n=1 Tax=Monomorium pharaonis TaxID=307658 RepID=UPI00063F6DD4|nr:glycine, alanine and asparagine-rich protein [Monomorium pharaonis]XP_036141788.1 glycine, alanine and asparagine-rich protein [Monomorium pharaonis]XP_036141789.1 glycine, alanine and asparagine-rich protein [Monomorium pharaonis]XP_036141790.1 glycine, alanine and asparagine-rich protein [Monomorium pharaonis]XP_036141791.1 glycine, alanine and asparagine-rich protein [Monomorium pharaonis]XP_036141792.1 glycine, alanine and asparagine-rich protein [Monomorium pharaonis]XP_036141794.1 gl
MKILLILLACVTLTYCAKAAKAKSKKQIHDQEVDGYEFEYASHDAPGLALVEPNSHYIEAGPVIAVAATGHRELARPGYSVGGPLASIAKGAADQAHTQLNQQPVAAGQAAYVAKNTLAQAAAQSAATAAAALAGKQIIVMGLEQQSRDAHVAVNGEQQQLQQAQRSATAAKNAAQQAMHQVQVITTALNAAQATAEHAAQAAAEAAAELAAQTTMVGQAKARAEAIDEQLAAARLDFETTQAAAQKAANAAQTAQNNAAAAAAHAAHTAAAASAAANHPVSLHDAEPEYRLVNALPIEGYEYKSYHF